MKANLFLAGDVMTGRGIDQILLYPGAPRIYEPFLTDARDYLALAEDASGQINYPVSFDYIWGEALPEIQKISPALRVVNLETAVTKSESYLPKGINYRMNPQNVEVLKTLRIDACALANNHILDWGEQGLLETITVLENSGIKPVGAGRNIDEAKKAAIFHLEAGNVILFAYAHPSSGVPVQWQARESNEGVNLLTDLSKKRIAEIKNEVAAVKRREDFVIISIHWGPNWGYRISEAFTDFAHGLIDRAGVDLVFGHSSHHFQGFEVYRDRLIVYGAGDFINDYEGISGYEEFRDDLTLMYFPEIDLETKQLVSLTLVPMQVKRFSLQCPSQKDIDWVLKVLQRESVTAGELVKKNGRRIYWKKGNKGVRSTH